MWRIINGAARACGIEGAIGTHTMRKTFGYHFYQQTKDVAMLQQIFGRSRPWLPFGILALMMTWWTRY
ncbi:hypothetical protein [Domibacillus aminovorans]|uniref:hypothetical protein n=1 Tax=Domibacillus aminovorans TaxID=29332 RepID=UPI000A89F0B7|nr:hypothetical protein [Domibacillus aminovorans]